MLRILHQYTSIIKAVSASVHFYYQGCLCINNFYYQRCRCINTLLLSRLYLHQYTSISKAVSTSIHFYYQDCLYFYYQDCPLFIKTFSGISSWLSSKLHVFSLIFPLKTSTYPLTTSQKKLSFPLILVSVIWLIILNWSNTTQKNPLNKKTNSKKMFLHENRKSIAT